MIWEEVHGTSSLTAQFEKRLMVLHHWQHNVKMYIFLDEIYFANGVSITFLFWILVLFFSQAFFSYQFHHYSTSIYQLHHYSSNFIITYQLHNNLSYFISFFLDPWIIWQLPFVSKFWCCECWLPFIRLNLYY